MTTKNNIYTIPGQQDAASKNSPPMPSKPKNNQPPHSSASPPKQNPQANPTQPPEPSGVEHTKNVRKNRQANDIQTKQEREMQEQLDLMRDEDIADFQSRQDSLQDWEKERLAQLLDEREYANKHRVNKVNPEEDFNSQIDDLAENENNYIPDRPDKAHLMKLRASTEQLDDISNHTSATNTTHNTVNILSTPMPSNSNSNNNNNNSAVYSNYLHDDEDYLKRQKLRQEESERLRKEREDTQKKLEQLRLKTDENLEIKEKFNLTYQEKNPGIPNRPAPNLSLTDTLPPPPGNFSSLDSPPPPNSPMHHSVIKPVHVNAYQPELQSQPQPQHPHHNQENQNPFHSLPPHNPNTQNFNPNLPTRPDLPNRPKGQGNVMNKAKAFNSIIESNNMLAQPFRPPGAFYSKGFGSNANSGYKKVNFPVGRGKLDEKSSEDIMNM